MSNRVRVPPKVSEREPVVGVVLGRLWRIRRGHGKHWDLEAGLEKRRALSARFLNREHRQSVKIDRSPPSFVFGQFRVGVRSRDILIGHVQVTHQGADTIILAVLHGT